MPAASDTFVYLGLGSNMGHRPAQIEEALAMLARLPETKLLRRSPLYESKPWGKSDQPDFLNMVVEISTSLDPQLLLRHAKCIEARLGRVPGEQWGPRPIDIDILLYGDRQLRTATLVVPHRRIWERHFVLRPLADLRPDLVAPDGAPIEKFLQREDIAAQEVQEYELERVTVNEGK